jgi:trans-aconitate methyltransferase
MAAAQLPSKGESSVTVVSDRWAVGAAYEAYMGRWSRALAKSFVDWLGVEARAHWLDVGCGTGALCERILKCAAPARVTGIDSSEGFLAHASAHVVDPRAEFLKGDAQALPVGDAGTDVVVSGLVLNFVPDKAKMATEMRRVTRPGGSVAVYVWDYAEGMQSMRRFWDAAVALRPAAAELDEAPRFPICHPDALRDLFSAAGFREVETRPIEIATVFENFDDYWTPFLGSTGPAPAYCMSLGEADRNALRDRLRASLPTGPDGKIALTARAYAVKGVA